MADVCVGGGETSGASGSEPHPTRQSAAIAYTNVVVSLRDLNMGLPHLVICLCRHAQHDPYQLRSVVRIGFFASLGMSQPRDTETSGHCLGGDPGCPSDESASPGARDHMICRETLRC